MPELDPLGNPIVPKEGNISPSVMSTELPVTNKESDTDPLGNPIIPKSPNLSENYHQVKDSDPEKNAKVLNISEKTGYPSAFVANNLETADKAFKGPSPDILNSMDETHPMLAKWLLKPEYISISHDVIPELQKHDSAWDHFNKGMMNLAGGINKALDLPTYSLGTIFGSNKWTLFHNNAQYIDEKLRDITTPDNSPEWSKALSATTHLDFEPLGKKMIEQIPNLVSMGLGAETLGPILTAGAMGIQTRGESYLESREKGMSPDISLSSSAWKGNIATLAYALPLKYFSAIYNPLVGTLGKGADSVIGWAATHWLKNSLAMGTQGAVQVVANATVDKINGQDPNSFDHIFKRMGEAGLGGFVLGSAMSSIGIAKASKEYGKSTWSPEKELEKDKDTAVSVRDDFLKLVTAAKDTKLTERYPTAYRKLAEQYQNTGEINAHIPVDDFKIYCQGENKNPDEQAKSMGIEFKKAFDEASEHGGNIKLSLSELLAHNAHTGSLEKLADHIKFGDGLEDYTVHETQEIAKKIAEQRQIIPKQVEDETAKVNQLKAFEKETGKKIEEVQGHKTAAKSISQFFKTMAEKSNQTIQSLISGNKIEYIKETQEQTDTRHKMEKELKEKFTLSPDQQERIWGQKQEGDKDFYLTAHNRYLNLIAAQRAKEGWLSAQYNPKTGDIQTGADHLMALNKTPAETRGQYIEGFVNRDGKFITRKEAEATYGFKNSGDIGLPSISKQEDVDHVSKILLNELWNGSVLYQGERGEIKMMGEPGKRTFKIYLNENSDASTFFHEHAHMFLEIFRDIASSEKATPEIKNMEKDLFNWFEVKGWDEITDKHHEQFARGFEYRLWEGNVPVPGMKNIFDRFMKWMREIYPTAEKMEQYLGVKMTSEMRDVYDRMLATHDEIDQAYLTMGYSKLPENATAEEQEKWLKTVNTAKQKAIDEVLKMKMGQLTKTEKEQEEDARAKTTKRITEQVNKLPVFKAIDALSESLSNPQESAKKILSGTATPEELKLFTRVAMDQFNVADPGHVALVIRDANREQTILSRVNDAMTDFQPKVIIPQNLIQEILHRGEAGEAALRLIAMERSRIQQKMLMERISKQFGSELKGRLEDMSEVSKLKSDMAKASQKQQEQDIAQAKADASRIIQGMKYKDARNSRTFITAERNYAIKAAIAEAKGDLAKAYEYKQKQLLNHELATQSNKIKDVTRRYLREIQKYAEMEKKPLMMPFGHWRIMKKLLEETGFKKETPDQDEIHMGRARDKENKALQSNHTPDYDQIANDTGFIKSNGQWRKESVFDFINRENLNPETKARISEEFVQAKIPGKDDMSVSQLHDIKNTLSVIFNDGNEGAKILVEGKKIVANIIGKQTADQLDEILGQPYKVNPMTKTNFQKRFDKFMEVIKNGAFTLPQNLSEICGLGHISGLFHGYDMKLNQGQTDSLKLTRDIAAEFKELISKHFSGENEKDFSKELFRIKTDKGDIEIFDREKLLNLTMLTGSNTSLERLHNGNKYTDRDLDEIKSHLKQNDVEFIKDVGQFHDKYFRKMVDMEIENHGYEPKGVDKIPIMTPHGMIDGMYHPLAYDYENPNGPKTEASVEIEDKSRPLNPFINKSMLQNRVKNYPYAVRLDNRVLENHLSQLIKYLSYDEQVGDINKFLNQKDMKLSLFNAFGKTGSDLYKQHLDYILHGERRFEGMDLYANQALKYMRVSNIMFHIGWRPHLFPTKLFSDLNSVIQEPGMGAKRALGYLMNVVPYSNEGQLSTIPFGNKSKIGWGGLHDTIQDVISKSEIMRERHKTSLNYDQYAVREFFQTLRGGEILAPLRASVFIFEQMADRCVAYSTWKDIYDEQMINHGDENTARAWADDKISKMFGSGNTTYHTWPMKGTELVKQLSPAFSFFGAMTNRAMTTGRIKYLIESRKQNPINDSLLRAKIIAASVLSYATIPALIEETARRTIYEREETKKKGKAGMVQFGKDLATKAALSPLQFLPGMRRFADSMREGESAAEKSISSIPAGEFAWDVWHCAKVFPKLFEKGKMTDRDIDDLEAGPSEIMGIPKRMDDILVNIHHDVKYGNWKYQDITGPIRGKRH